MKQKKKYTPILSSSEKKVLKQKKTINILVVLLIISILMNVVFYLDIEIPFINPKNNVMNYKLSVDKDDNIVVSVKEEPEKKEETTKKVIQTEPEKKYEALKEAYNDAEVYEMSYTDRPITVKIVGKEEQYSIWFDYNYIKIYGTDGNTCYYLPLEDGDGLLDLIQAEGNEFRICDTSNFVDMKGRAIYFEPEEYINYDMSGKYTKLYPTQNWNDILTYCQKLIEKGENQKK